MTPIIAHGRNPSNITNQFHSKTLPRVRARPCTRVHNSLI
nr:MAG TPA: hypothetical protein [Caudoviricetes sp.]